MKVLSGVKITGIIYQEEGTDEKKLQSGLNIDVKLLTNSKVVGVLYHDDSADESILSDLQLDGLTYWTTTEDDERILAASKIVAILYGDPVSLGRNNAPGRLQSHGAYPAVATGNRHALSGRRFS